MLIEEGEFRLRVFDSGKPGLTVAIVGGVHGDETCGLYAIKALENYLFVQEKLLQGRLLTLIANQKAIQYQKRYIDYDLNRTFGNPDAFGHELLLSQKLIQYLKGIDYLLDLHSTSAPTLSFCAGTLTDAHLRLFALTGIIIYTYGWEIHRGYTMLIDEINRLGGVGVIAECGIIGRRETNRVALESCLSFIQGLGMIPSKQQEEDVGNRTIIKIEEIVKVSSDKFSFTRQFNNFDPIQPETVVAYDNEKPIAYPYPFVMAMPTQGKLKVGDEAFGVGFVEKKFSV